MNTQHITQLTKVILSNKLYGYPPTIHPHLLESDGRRRPRILHDLLSDQYLNVINGVYTATEKILNRLKPEEFNINEIWVDQLRNNVNKLAFVDIENLHPEAKKYIISNPDKFEFYFGDHSLFATPEKYNTSVITQGPYTLEYIRQNYLTYKANLRRSYNASVYITNSELKEYSRTYEFNTKLQLAFDTNLQFGLVEQNILTEDEVNILNLQKEHGLTVSTHLTNKPDEWTEEKTHDRIVHLNKLVETQTQRLEILKKLQNNILKLGGWEVFKKLYKEQLENKLKKEVGETTKETKEIKETKETVIQGGITPNNVLLEGEITKVEQNPTEQQMPNKVVEILKEAGEQKAQVQETEQKEEVKV